MDTGFVRGWDPSSTKVRRDACRKREREEAGENHKTARKTGHPDNPGEEKRRRGGKEVEMVFGVEVVGNCSVDLKCTPETENAHYSISMLNKSGPTEYDAFSHHDLQLII